MQPLILCLGIIAGESAGSGAIDFGRCVVITRENAPAVEQTAAAVLVEEVRKRTGLEWSQASALPALTGAIVITSSLDGPLWGNQAPQKVRARLRERKPEGYHVYCEPADKAPPIVWIVGADQRGTLYGVGHLLRKLALSNARATLAWPIDILSAPVYPLRGHQLGYRARANSYDAWDVPRFDQYVRELALFGANAVENIPFQDRDDSPHMRVPRREMNRRLSEVCQRYDMEYWVWTPADFDLNDAARRDQALSDHEQLYSDCARLDGIFVPGGDPGDNHPKLVMPFLADLATRLAKRHPRGKVWLSMQGYDADEWEFVHAFIEREQPTWLGGLVHGPSSPSIVETRRRLPTRYALRHYPDLTHNIRCQFPLPWWDPALEATLGREAINPTPIYHARIHNAFAPHTSGFLSYSDGCHDDVNKVTWTMRAWDPQADVREILIEYSRYFFGHELAAETADAILALERNWQGSLRDNGAVDATLALWKDLDRRAPSLRDNWRWQMCLLRANYDCYTRHRLIFESDLEEAANAALAEAGTRGPGPAIDAALAILRRADTQRPRPELRAEIERLCEALFRSIGLQTSVPRYHAAGSERGAVWDFVDYPLNNRWWLEDEFAAIRKLPGRDEQLARVERIRTWEHPGPGSFYDDVGNVAKSPHVLRGESPETDPLRLRTTNPTFHESGRPRARQSWHSYMDWPLGVRYDALDATAKYVIRTTGLRECLLNIDGQRVQPTLDGKEMGEFKEFPVPTEALADGSLIVTFDKPPESHLNWRQRSRLTEIWLLKR